MIGTTAELREYQSLGEQTIRLDSSWQTTRGGSVNQDLILFVVAFAIGLLVGALFL